MTKMLLLSSTMLMLMYKMYYLNIIIIILSLSIIMFIMDTSLKFYLTSMFVNMDSLSIIMILLTLMSVALIILSSSSLNSIMYTIIPIMLILLITFSSKKILMFYIMFELVLIPTMILITMNGKQPERLQASIYLIIYTVLASLPLLMSIIFFKMNMSFLYSHIYMLKLSMIAFIMMAFLVKMPMYFTHLWLPKAHVEAPLEGSMILAAVLLKLGGYGIIRFMPTCILSFNKMNYWIMSISLIGATATSMNCIRQKDLKSLIAYSSVAHMGFVLTGLFSLNYMGLTGAIIMMIGHGLSSSALFLLVNDLYFKYHSRNILMFKGMLTLMPNISFWWFMFMALNISAPPSINTFSEIMLMSNLLLYNMNSIAMIFMMSLMTATFSLMMFISITHNKTDLMPSIHTPQKIFLSLFLHLSITIILISKMEIMMYYYNSLMKTMACGAMIFHIINTSINLMMFTLLPLIISFLLIQINSFTLIKIPLLNLNSLLIQVDMLLDWTSLSFMGTVMMISSLIIMFSKYYIPNKEHNYFLILLLMFVLSMTILILSNNLFLVLLGWDGLGLSSYILVVYYQNSSSSASGTITLLSNRIGDILILLSMALITISSNWNLTMNMEFSTITMMFLLIAACSKSAQFPFSAWLPMAMAAPTPISALVHSSTLVTAGVFLMLRISTYTHPTIMMILLIISTSTAIYASLSANWEQDLKKIIALSTLSQIAMMMFAISMNSLMLAFTHLIIHAMFKSAMFLCAGIMIHESSYQDMRMMGLNFSKHPLTLSMLGINSMALMGIPFMSGFFSKDLIIENLVMSNLNFYLTMIMIMSIGMTMSYSMRMSMHSNKPNMKMQSLLSNHSNLQATLPIMLLSMLAITSGSWMTWILSPDQIFLVNFSTKLMIIMNLLLGFMIGFSFQFKNKKYIKMGLSSISLWFTHFLSVIPTQFMYPLMHMFHNNDKNWQEQYGPNKFHSNLMMLTTIPEISKSSLLMIMMLVLLLPIFIM